MNQIIWAAWLAIGVVWLAAAAGAKRADRAEAARSRRLHLLNLAVGFGLVFAPVFQAGWLGARFVPGSARAAAEAAGTGLAVAGAALSIWARLALGGNWSAVVSIQREHELIRHGPYGWVRHPIYSGFLLAFLGTTLALGEVRGIIGFLVAAAGWVVKLRREEKFLREQFGESYRRYQSEVKAVIPFVI